MLLWKQPYSHNYISITQVNKTTPSVKHYNADVSTSCQWTDQECYCIHRQTGFPWKNHTVEPTTLHRLCLPHSIFNVSYSLHTTQSIPLTNASLFYAKHSIQTSLCSQEPTKAVVIDRDVLIHIVHTTVTLTVMQIVSMKSPTRVYPIAMCTQTCNTMPSFLPVAFTCT